MIRKIKVYAYSDERYPDWFLSRYGKKIAGSKSVKVTEEFMTEYEELVKRYDEINMIIHNLYAKK